MFVRLGRTVEAGARPTAIDFELKVIAYGAMTKK